MSKKFLSRLIIIALAAPLALVLGCNSVNATGSGSPFAASAIPKPVVDDALASAKGQESLVLAGGCFWGIQAVFKVVYDPSQITYGQLLQIFFAVHDPTTVNQQGPDRGTQYRSVIFYASPDQQKIADAYIKQLDAAKVFSGPIVTQVAPFKAFYTAEAYHQDYAANHPHDPYIMICDLPKLSTLKKDFPDFYRE